MTSYKPEKVESSSVLLGVLSYANFFLKGLLLLFTVIAFSQDYLPNIKISLFGYLLKPFYFGVFVRILPLTVLSFIAFRIFTKIFQLQKPYTIQHFLFYFLLCFDAFCHITNLYSLTYTGFSSFELGWDKLMHFLTGFFLYLSFFPLLRDYFNRHNFHKNIQKITFWFALGLFSIFSIIWEIIELLAAIFADANFLFPTQLDSAMDMAMNYAGLLLASTLFWLFDKTKIRVADQKLESGFSQV